MIVNPNRCQAPALTNPGSSEKVSWKACLGKAQKVEQALGHSLRKIFEQLVWRVSPGAVLVYLHPIQL